MMKSYEIILEVLKHTHRDLHVTCLPSPSVCCHVCDLSFRKKWLSRRTISVDDWGTYSCSQTSMESSTDVIKLTKTLKILKDTKVIKLPNGWFSKVGVLKHLEPLGHPIFPRLSPRT